MSTERTKPLRRTALSLLVCAGLADCWNPPAQPVLGYESNDEACTDSNDNDRDGLVDCEDDDCLQFSAVCGERIPVLPSRTPEDGFLACSDGVDNDGDGQFDCGDRGCQTIMELCCAREFDNASCSRSQTVV